MTVGTRKVLVFGLLGITYYAAGKFGLSLAYLHPSATTVWAPTGIALAALLLYGHKYWPAIFVGAFLVNVTTAEGWLQSLTIAAGNTMEAVLGAYLVNLYADGKHFYNRPVNISKYLLFTSIAALISATVGLEVLILESAEPLARAGLTWLAWWLGDMGGAIIVTPLILLLFDKDLVYQKRGNAAERVLFLVCLIGLSIIIFGNVFKNHPMGFLLIPLLVWPSMRFSQRESAISTFLVAGIAIAATLADVGPFIQSYQEDSLLMLQAYLGMVSLTTLILAASVAERNSISVKLSEAYDHALEGWSHALDLRDKEMEGHARRVADLSVRLGKKLGLSELELINIKRGALLHDIGKMAIPDHILFKKGELTKEEWMIMQKHPIYASDFISHMSYFKGARDIPYCHHEKWDGSGYPEGLKGTQIPLIARIFTIVDVWDAMRSHRPYRQAQSDKEVLEYMESLSGTHFDPDLLEVFVVMVKNEPLENSLEEALQISRDLKNEAAV